MPSITYEVFREAIQKKKPVSCTYKGLYREICPHTLGHTADHEQALSFQFAGQSSRGLPPEGEWRCMKLDDVQDAKLIAGSWHTADNHSRPQTCVKQIEFEVEYV